MNIVLFAATPNSAAANPKPMAQWFGYSPVAGPALEEVLDGGAAGLGRGDAAQRAATLAMLLSVWPMSSAHWLSLAGVRVAAGKPSPQMIEALRMSLIVGPNEGAVMAERGIFGLLQWEALTEGLRRRIAADLAAAVNANTMSETGVRAVRNILAQQPSRKRSEIVGLLKTEGLSPASLQRLGI